MTEIKEPSEEVKELELPKVPLPEVVETPKDETPIESLEKKNYDVDIMVGDNVVSVITLQSTSKESAEFQAHMTIKAKAHNKYE
jgi:hypothetical protein